MKYKTTDKELKQAKNLISCGYCELQHALYWFSPIAYTAGQNGWKADVYHFDGFTLVTGYSTPSHAIEIPLELTTEINDQASEIDSMVDRMNFVKSELKKYVGIVFPIPY